MRNMGGGAKGIDCLGEATHSIRKASQARKVILLSDSIRVEKNGSWAYAEMN